MTEITADSFKNSQTVMQTVRQDVDIGLFPRDQFPIHPDFRYLLHHEPIPPLETTNAGMPPSYSEHGSYATVKKFG
jgi:hypothetical protein